MARGWRSIVRRRRPRRSVAPVDADGFLPISDVKLAFEALKAFLAAIERDDEAEARRLMHRATYEKSGLAETGIVAMSRGAFEHIMGVGSNGLVGPWVSTTALVVDETLVCFGLVAAPVDPVVGDEVGRPVWAAMYPDAEGWRFWGVAPPDLKRARRVDIVPYTLDTTE
jgi:hypothetical protein